MISRIPSSRQKKIPYGKCFDNLFASFSLLKRLKTLGYEGTGTMRENQIGRNCSNPDSKSCKEKPRGYIASAKNIDDDSIWYDKNTVMLLPWPQLSMVVRQ